MFIFLLIFNISQNLKEFSRITLKNRFPALLLQHSSRNYAEV
jgi:hypothetical protein